LVAATVSVDELPVVIEVGLAVMLTAGADGGSTVTVALEDAVPPVPVAVAVYAVVAAGETTCVPPVDDRI
jgi:hypothetical protein